MNLVLAAILLLTVRAIISLRRANHAINHIIARPDHILTPMPGGGVAHPADCWCRVLTERSS